MMLSRFWEYRLFIGLILSSKNGPFPVTGALYFNEFILVFVRIWLLSCFMPVIIFLPVSVVIYIDRL